MSRVFIHSLSRIRRSAFDCPWTFSRTETCTMWIECLFELKCTATGLSLLSLMSHRCSSTPSFSCCPVFPTYTTFPHSVHVNPFMMSLSVHMDSCPAYMVQTLQSALQAGLWWGMSLLSLPCTSISDRLLPASILRKSILVRHRPVSYPDGPMTAR